jgi:hypothetical protein
MLHDVVHNICRRVVTPRRLAFAAIGDKVNLTRIDGTRPLSTNRARAGHLEDGFEDELAIDKGFDHRLCRDVWLQLQQALVDASEVLYVEGVVIDILRARVIPVFPLIC